MHVQVAVKLFKYMRREIDAASLECRMLGLSVKALVTVLSVSAENYIIGQALISILYFNVLSLQFSESWVKRRRERSKTPTITCPSWAARRGLWSGRWCTSSTSLRSTICSKTRRGAAALRGLRVLLLISILFFSEADKGAKLSLNRVFSDERWSRHRLVTCLDWSEQV